MLYNAYELQRSWMSAASAWADLSGQWLKNPMNPLAYSNVAPMMASGLDVFAHASASRGKPNFGFVEVEVNGKKVPVTEEIFRRPPPHLPTMITREFFRACSGSGTVQWR